MDNDINVISMYTLYNAIFIETNHGKYTIFLMMEYLYVKAPNGKRGHVYITWDDDPEILLNDAIKFLMNHFGIKGDIPKEVLSEFVKENELEISNR